MVCVIILMIMRVFENDIHFNDILLDGRLCKKM